jgi:hypothetical protein
VDRIEVVGNLPGHVADEFNDGILDPAWHVYRPTVTESGGVLTLSSPGRIGSVSLPGGVFMSEETVVDSNTSSPLSVQDGAGDFTGTSTWLPGLPQVGQRFGMDLSHQLGSGLPGLLESISINIVNLEPGVTAALGVPPIPPGKLAVLFGRVASDVGEYDFQAFVIDPANVTGDIQLQLAFDDTTNQFTGAFSLDGGGTYESPFTPVSLSVADPNFEWGMSAMSIQAVPEPDTYAMLLVGLGLVGFAVRRKLA